MNPQETPQLTPIQRKAVGRKLLEAEIVARAWADDAFRAKLEADPVAAIAEAGLPVPKEKTIRIIHEASDALTLVVSHPPARSEEVDDKQLADVAGGGYLQNGSCHVAELAEKREASQLTKLGTEIVLLITPGLSWGWG